MDEKDRGYRKDCARFKVRLDGVVQRGLLTADDDTGMVIRAKRDTDTGLLIIDPTTGTLVDETVYGRVKINLGGGK